MNTSDNFIYTVEAVSKFKISKQKSKANANASVTGLFYGVRKIWGRAHTIAVDAEVGKFGVGELEPSHRSSEPVHGLLGKQL